jgi:putative Holliday junction resolvase
VTEPGTVIGIDYGTRRIGVAASDPARVTAFPVAVVDVDDDMWERLVEVVRDREATLVVVGLPVGLSGAEGASALAARTLGEELGRRTGLPIEYADERFTTRSAEQLLVASNVKRRKRRTVVDSMAASVMLQSYLDTRTR